MTETYNKNLLIPVLNGASAYKQKKLVVEGPIAEAAVGAPAVAARVVQFLLVARQVRVVRVVVVAQ